MRFFTKFLIIAFLTLSGVSFAQYGKLAGIVKDSQTGEALFGANVIVEGTTIGAATDPDGYYVIQNISPGEYRLKVSMIGFTSQTIVDVDVNINQTTTINVNLKSEDFQTEEIVVVAQREIVKKDISSSTADIGKEQIQNLPIANVSTAVSLQAGVQGLSIRGGSSDQTAFMLNGFVMRDERDNTPFTGVSITSVSEVQIQTGGFNAEYGNIRSGLINVVTSEGSRDEYSFTFFGRYKNAAPKYYGSSPGSVGSYWIRPYVDPSVAFTGTTNGAWDDFVQKQFQKFDGWNAVSQRLLTDSDPNNDLTPEAAQQLFLWQHRRVLNISEPDYDMDMTLSGPVPFVSKDLGGLRFVASYRGTQEMYMIPLSDDRYNDYSANLKLTSDLMPGMKITFDGLMGQQTGTASSLSGVPGLFRGASGIASSVDWRNGESYMDTRVFVPERWNPSTVERSLLGVKFTHVVDPKVYYEINFSRFSSDYTTNPGRTRDLSKVYNIGGVLFDESPYGYPLTGSQSAGIGSSMNMGLGISTARDTSVVAAYTLKADVSGQMNQYVNFKAGVEFIYTDNNVRYGLYEPSLPTNNSVSIWHTFPLKGAIYAQNKLEFEGMIANIGLRLDYSDPGGQWYDLSDYDPLLSGANFAVFESQVKKKDIKSQVMLSPRLGIAFPISVNSKLYFNYGHFTSMPTPEQLFLIRRSVVSRAVIRLANPDNPLPKTVAYELGYEHNLFDMFLLRVAGYYKDIFNQPRLVTYVSRDNTVSYTIPEPNNYADIRGFEFTLSKNVGDWIQGFFNYTYDVSTAGNFGYPTIYENSVLMRDQARNTTLFEQSVPVPRPYARFNIDIFTPREFGGELFEGFYPLEDLRVNLLGSWQSGVWFTWTGPGASTPGIVNNVQWQDRYGLDMRISKKFRMGDVALELFADINNALNIKYMEFQGGFVNAQDYWDYMKSLHLPSDIAGLQNYGNISGDDRPGDIRTGEYIPWDDKATDAQKDEWRKNKSYIDMPNLDYAAFLNPRAIYYGIRFTYDF